MATLCFDLDGTLCTTTGGDYKRAEPFPWAIARVNELVRAGHRVVIFTARGSATGIDWEPVTREQLARWGVDYDELHFGKPSADVFIDDRAVHTDTWRLGDGFGPPGLAVAAVAGGSELWADLPVSSPAEPPVIVEFGRTFGGLAPRLADHVARARALAGAAGIACLPSSEKITAAVQGALGDGHDGHDVVFAIRLADGGNANRLDAWDGSFEAKLRVDCRDLCELSAGLAGLMPGSEVAVRAGFGSSSEPTWPLQRADDGTISAGLGGALGIVVGGTVRVEPPSAPYAQVAGDWLRQIALSQHVAVEAGPLNGTSLEQAEEAFIVGLPFCLLPLATIDTQPLAAAPGTVTRRLLEAWSSEVGIDISAQTSAGLKRATGPTRRRTSRSGVTVVIPARLRSSRLPDKVLADIAGRPMIEHVYQAGLAAGCGPVLVLTDSDEVAEVVRSFGGEVWLTDPQLESGTARIASVAQRLETEVVINLQGDAPLIDPAVVTESGLRAARTGAPVTMAVYHLEAQTEIRDPSVVKVVRAHDGQVLYCSRSVIPFRRDGFEGLAGASFWGHAGLYAYSREFLRTFHKLPTSSLETTERLEQLRWLEAGVRIHSFVIEPQESSVDTPADLDRVRQAYLNRVSA